MDELKEDITKFSDIFEANLDAIKSVQFKVRDNLFKKILCGGVIDALSKGVYPGKARNIMGTRLPFGFFYKICETSLTELKKYLNDNQINPYDNFVFGEYLIDDLNL